MQDRSDIVAACLADIEAGRATIEDCVNRHPDIPGLRGALHLALSLPQLNRESMPEVRKTALERRLLHVMEANKRQAPTRPAWVALRRVAVLAAMLILTSAAVLGVAQLSRSALPGDVLYGYKRGVESIEVAVASAANQRPSALMTVALTRVNEMRLVAIRDRGVSQTQLDDMLTAVNAAMDAERDPLRQTTLYLQSVDALNFASAQGSNTAASTIAQLATPIPLIVPTATTRATVAPSPTSPPLASATVATTTPALPTETTTALTTVAPTLTASATLTATALPDTATVALSVTPSPTPSSTLTETATPRRLVTATPLASFTPSATPTPTVPSATPTASLTPSATSPIPTVMFPTVTPVPPTVTATFTPLVIIQPTQAPTVNLPPTITPITAATQPPTETPSATESPTKTPAPTEDLLPCPSATPTSTLADVVEPTPTDTETRADASVAQAPTPTPPPCLTWTPTPTPSDGANSPAP